MNYLESTNVADAEVAGFFLVAFYYNNEKSDKETTEETGRPVL